MSANRGAQSQAQKFPCPCCGQNTLGEPSPGSWEICPLCGWEDDPVQYADSDFSGGANRLSLKEAKMRLSLPPEKKQND